MGATWRPLWACPAALGLALLVLTAPALGQDDTQTTDRTALLALRDALTATPANFWNRSRWSDTTFPCTPPVWAHIKCENSMVTEINLSKGGARAILEGTMPWASLASMTSLRKLIMSSQRITGQYLPQEAQVMPSLTFVDMANNQLTELTPQMTLFTSLERLNLANNTQLVGTIPSEISALSMLTTLGLADCRGITGPIPETISSITSLKIMNLYRSNYSGAIPTLSTLTALEILNLGGNKLTGSFPPGVLSLTGLTFMDIGNNMLGGPVPAEFWPSESRLIIANNYFSGAVPGAAGRRIKFDGNCLTNTNVTQKSPEVCSAFYAVQPPPAPPSPPPSGSSTNLGLIIGLSVAGGILILVLIGLLIWLLMPKRSSEDYDEEDGDEEDGDHDEEEEEGEEEEDDDDDDDNRRDHR